MLLKVHCNKCLEDFKLDIGTMKKDDVIEKLKKQNSFHCNAGNHMEISSPVNYWVFGDVVPGELPSMEQWLKDLKKAYKEVYENKDLSINYEVVSFSYGCCICKNKTTGKKAYFDFRTAPNNTRYYYKIGDA